MKLYKALKLRKRLIGDITNLKKLIGEKNSYLEGAINDERSDVNGMYTILLQKINKLAALKYVINEANREIQAQIYILSEYKALIKFMSDLDVSEGVIKMSRYGDSTALHKAHINEDVRDSIVKAYQIKVDAIQDEIDEFNYSTDIPWEDISDDDREPTKPEIKKK